MGRDIVPEIKRANVEVVAVARKIDALIAEEQAAGRVTETVVPGAAPLFAAVVTMIAIRRGVVGCAVPSTDAVLGVTSRTMSHLMDLVEELMPTPPKKTTNG